MRVQTVLTVLTTQRMLIVTFSRLPGGPVSGRSPAGEVRVLPANFSARINSDEDIADMLLMIMTYNPALQ